MYGFAALTIIVTTLAVWGFAFMNDWRGAVVLLLFCSALELAFRGFRAFRKRRRI